LITTLIGLIKDKQVKCLKESQRHKVFTS